MAFLVTVGDSRQSAMDQAKLIIGDGANIIDEGHADNMSYFQFNASPAVSAPERAFQAGIQGKTVFVYWVIFD